MATLKKTAAKQPAAVRTAASVGAGDVWSGKSNAERKAWLKKAGCPTHWDTTTYEDLPEDVRTALEAE